MRAILFIATLILPGLLASTALAQQYVPLAPIPGVTSRSGAGGFVEYLNVLFLLLIGVAAVAAVIKITIGGLRYMMSEAFGTKGAAKADIYGAILGLIIILATVIILRTINPGLLNFDFLSGAGLTPLPPRPTVTQGSLNTTDLNEAQQLIAQLECEENETAVLGQHTGTGVYYGRCEAVGENEGSGEFTHNSATNGPPQQGMWCVQEGNFYYCTDSLASCVNARNAAVGHGALDLTQCTEVGTNIGVVPGQEVETVGDATEYTWYCPTTTNASAVWQCYATNQECVNAGRLPAGSTCNPSKTAVAASNDACISYFVTRNEVIAIACRNTETGNILTPDPTPIVSTTNWCAEIPGTTIEIYECGFPNVDACSAQYGNECFSR